MSNYTPTDIPAIDCITSVRRPDSRTLEYTVTTAPIRGGRFVIEEGVQKVVIRHLTDEDLAEMDAMAKRCEEAAK